MLFILFVAALPSFASTGSYGPYLDEPTLRWDPVGHYIEAPRFEMEPLVDGGTLLAGTSTIDLTPAVVAPAVTLAVETESRRTVEAVQAAAVVARAQVR